MLGQFLIVALVVSVQSNTICDIMRTDKCAISFRHALETMYDLNSRFELYCIELQNCTDEQLLCNATLTEIQSVKSRCWVIPSPNTTSNPTPINTTTTDSTIKPPTTLSVSSNTTSSEEVTPTEETTEAPVTNVTISAGTLGNTTTTTTKSTTTQTVSVNTTLPATTPTDAPTTSPSSTSTTTTESTTEVQTTPHDPYTVATTYTTTPPSSDTTESTQGTTYHPPVTEPSSTGTTTWYFPKYLDIVTTSCVAQLEAAGGQHSDLVNIVNGAIFVAEYMDPPIQFYQCYYLNDQYWMQRGLDSVSQICGAYDANILRTRLINIRNQLGCDVFGTIVYTH
ncbi:hypothetical protein CRE_09388 [Caenorhabditis remanei]|uniref:DUF19 domain-containing protein n=1 Tax=Caenorhabditis remanei TaxID=31234 RepID=E3LIJ8_CAERE|nr:hypothetical protein CRE_09388 [Caenorhabditis remanei]